MFTVRRGRERPWKTTGHLAWHTLCKGKQWKKRDPGSKPRGRHALTPWLSPHHHCVMLACLQTYMHTPHSHPVNKYKQKSNILLVISFSYQNIHCSFSELPIQSQQHPRKTSGSPLSWPDHHLSISTVCQTDLPQRNMIKTFPPKPNRLSTIMFYIFFLTSIYL